MDARPPAIVLTALVVLAAGSSASAAEPDLGRLFFTPEQRSALERQRSSGRVQSQATETSAIAINGIVKRSSGKQTIWINGVPQHDDNVPGGIRVASDPADVRRARIATRDGSSVEVRVGEVLRNVGIDPSAAGAAVNR